jgi:predicted nucleic acid-binding protein
MGTGIKFADLIDGQTVFLDANPLIDHFSANPRTGPESQSLLARIANQELTAITSTHILGEMAHRLMSIEACAKFGWPYQSIAQRLAKHPTEVQQLTQFRTALDDVARFGIQVLPVHPQHVALAADIIVRHGLLFNDSLVVALMETQGIHHLASSDTDFDCVPSIIRCRPI